MTRTSNLGVFTRTRTTARKRFVKRSNERARARSRDSRAIRESSENPTSDVANVYVSPGDVNFSGATRDGAKAAI